MSLLLLAATTLWADQQQKVTLSEEKTHETIEMPGLCRLLVTASDANDDGEAVVTIDIENLQDDEVIVVFGRSYLEKELKRQSPSIRFDKIIPKGNRQIDTFKPIGERAKCINPGDNFFQLKKETVKRDATTKYVLPLYVAKYRNKKRTKLFLMRKVTQEIEVTVEQKIDKDYKRLEKAVDDLINVISKETFCPNRRHSPNLSRQERAYKEQIEERKKEIESIRSKKGYFSSDKKGEQYLNLVHRLDAIKFHEEDCGKHIIAPPVDVHRCKYCNQTPRQIYEKLDKINQTIYGSSDRKAAKDNVMPDVNLLMDRHHNRGEYESRIQQLYNKISNY